MQDLAKINVTKLMNTLRSLGYNYAGNELPQKYLNISVRGHRILNRFSATIYASMKTNPGITTTDIILKLF